MAGSTYGTADGATYGGLSGSIYGVFTADTATTEVRAADPQVDTDIVEADIVDAFSRFASSATVHFLDPDGTKNDTFFYGIPIELQATDDGGGTWTRLFDGMVADTVRTTNQGPPRLRAEGVENDHFLRREHPDKTYSSTTITNILKDLIETFTPVTWNADLVTPVNDTSITREFKGTRVDEAIAFLASESGDEEWGVNDDFEFFFREQAIDRAPSIGDADVIEYDLPEEGKRAINKFTLYYDSGGSEKAIVVRDRESQQRLQDELGTDRPVVIADSDTRPEITDEDRAETVARQALTRQSVIQTGDVTVPLGRFDTNAGDILDLTISDADISGEGFRVAQVEHRFGRGETVLTVAENSASNVESLLVGLSDSVDNDRARDADITVTPTEFLDLESGVTLSVDASVTTKTPTPSTALYNQAQYNQATYNGGVDSQSSTAINSHKATKDLLNLCRDLWADGNSAFVDLTHLAFGTDGTTATVADGNLGSEVARASVSKFGQAGAAEQFELIADVDPGAISDAGTLRELSIADGAETGNHYARVTFDGVDLGTANDPTGSTYGTTDGDTYGGAAGGTYSGAETADSERLKAHIVVTVDTDSTLQGVITSTGQERLRDLVIGKSGHEPTDAVYGEGTTAAAESDTSLGNNQHEDTIDTFTDREFGVVEVIERITAGDADTTDFSETGWENSSDELLSRVVFAPFDSDVVVETNWKFRARNA